MNADSIEGMMRSTLFAISCFAVVVSDSTQSAYAEGGAPTTLKFRMIGDKRRVYDVLLRSHISKGMMFTRVGKQGRWTTDYGSARYWTKPVCIDYSKEVGQLAVVRYLLGGGTGVSISRFVILRAHQGLIQRVGRGHDDCHEWSRASVSQSYRIRTAFEGGNDGLIRRVSLSIPKDEQLEQSVEVAEYTVCYKASNWHGAFELRPQVDQRDAVCLIRLLNDERSGIRARAAEEISLLWPSCRKYLPHLLKVGGGKLPGKAMMRVKKIVLSQYDLPRP